MDAFLTWLVEGGVGPAGVGLPVTWAASELANASRRWFQRLRRSDDLGRIVRAATDDDVDLTRAEFSAVRDLLKQENTWTSLGRGTVEDLADRIAECLQGRARAESLQAGRAIAAGLLEFATGDLEPEWFQKVLFARLARLETGQAGALDRAMTGLAVLLDCREIDGRRLGQMTGQLDLILARIPPGPADRREVMVYLAALIRWLNSDPWTQGSQWTQQALTPADIERKLRVADSGGSGRDLDADELGRDCSRLVVLGGSGSGKTWLAKRTARLSAEAALVRLVDGADLGEVELPLYTTCAGLAEQKSGGIRHAVVESALSHLPDLGGTRAEAAIRELFGERIAATLLVLDSLDEARNADRRIGQADSLPDSWRIMLTSRPGSWNRQLTIRDGNARTRTGSLLPLSYPDDIKAFVQAWFRDQPGRAEALAAQISDRQDLQETVTVPLLLTFCCIIGGDQPLPGRRTDLYEMVVKRMLTGQWRGSGLEPEYDLDTCMDTLCEWAWSAAVSDPVSGVGGWEDEFSTPRVADLDNREALGHVAVPLDQADINTRTRRRFVHRSVHEHLVARRVSRMPALESASILLGHVWYDPDWEYAAPAAVAMHPHREQVLRELVRQVTGGDQTAAGIRAIDGCWEFRRLLARVAHESSQADWPPEAAGLIGQARADLMISRLGCHHFIADDWPTSNRLVFERLLVMADQGRRHARGLAWAVAGPGAEAEERAAARQALLHLLLGQEFAWRSGNLAREIAALDPTAEERAATRQALLRLLARERIASFALDLAEAIVMLGPTAEERVPTREALLHLLVDNMNDSSQTRKAADLVAELAVGAEERASTRQALLHVLPRINGISLGTKVVEVIGGLAVGAEERASTRQALLHVLPRVNGIPIRNTAAGVHRRVVEVIGGLAVGAEERASTRQALLDVLPRINGISVNRTVVETGMRVAEVIGDLAVGAEERAATRQELLHVLPRCHISVVRDLAQTITGLDPTAEERAVARKALLRLLLTENIAGYAGDLARKIAALYPTVEERCATRQALVRVLPHGHISVALDLAETIATLDPTAEERSATRQALLLRLPDTMPVTKTIAEVIGGLVVGAEERASTRRALLRLLPRVDDIPAAGSLAKAIAALDPTAEEHAATRQVLLRLLLNEGKAQSGRAEVLATLDPTAEERAMVRQVLLRLLLNEGKAWFVVERLAKELAGLDPTAEERAAARQALCLIYAFRNKSTMVPLTARELAETVAGLAVGAEERTATQRALLRLLPDVRNGWDARDLVMAVAGLAVEPTERTATQRALLPLLPDVVRSEWDARGLAKAVAGLAVGPEERASTRQALLHLIANTNEISVTRELAEAVAGLGVIVADLDHSRTWRFPPTATLLAAARRNSELRDWLAALPLLSDTRAATDSDSTATMTDNE